MPEWAVGVTTVPERLTTHLPRTLGSLYRAGFAGPRLFVDGPADAQGLPKYFHSCSPWFDRVSVTVRDPLVRVAMNWTLGLWELYARQPRADFYAMFQDDVLICRDAREYVERQKLWERGRVYLNLGTLDIPSCPVDHPNSNRRLSREHTGPGWFKSNQLGWGALGLVFSNEGVRDLLSSRLIVDRPWSDAGRGWRGIDGGIAEALCRSAQLREGRPYTEYMHRPSLLQHVGATSTIDKRKTTTTHEPNFPRYQYCEIDGCTDWPGEDWSPLTLL